MTSGTSSRPVSPLRARMIEDMTVRGFKDDTRRDYVRHERAFAAFIGRSPDTATAEELRLFQLHQTWLGGFQPPNEARPNEGWQWITGEPWAYTNWAAGEPNDFFGPASEQYLVYDEGKGKWNDVPLNWGFVDGYIVEFDALPTPEPSTLGLIALPVLAMFYCSVLRRPRT